MRICELTSVSELIDLAASRFGDQVALENTDSSRCAAMTYVELRDWVRGATAVFGRLGLTPGDRILLALEARPEWAASFFAILASGLVVVPIPADSPPAAVASIAAHAETKVSVVSKRTEGLVSELRSVTPIPVETLFDGEKTAESAHRAAADDLAILAFTSGSTRQPRAVELTHSNLLSDLDSVLKVRSAPPGCALLSMLPPAHMFELMGGLLGPLACGARVVYTPTLLPNRLIAALHEHRITHALAVPALVGVLYQEVLDQLVMAGLVEAERRHNSPAESVRRIQEALTETELQRIRAAVRERIGDTFRTLAVGGAAVDPSMADVLGPFGVEMEIGYGLTEASPIVSVGVAGQCPRGSVGRPLPGVDLRVDDNGEILVRGPNVMRGYYKDPEATAVTLKNGWLHTGDHGCLDTDGFLFITGRLKEAIVTRTGETVYPEEVESYYRSPLFSEICVTAAPDCDGNDLAVLFIVPAEREASQAELADVFKRLRDAAPAKFRVHRMVRLSEALPRTASGKIQRHLLGAAEGRHLE